MNLILRDREARAQQIDDLHNNYPDLVIVSLRLNIVGGEKNVLNLQWVLWEIDQQIKMQLDASIISRNLYESLDGRYILYTIKGDVKTIKNIMIDIESMSPIGRIVDIDVYNDTPISRTDLNKPKRKCIICESDADLCVRSKKHSKEDVMNEINAIARTALIDKLYNETIQSMIDELKLYPCFGLVSYEDSGAHSDMDFHTFEKSIEALKKAVKRYLEADLEPEMLNQIGRYAEKEMFEATNGVNTHKGLIFLLGVFLPSYKHAIEYQLPLNDLKKYIVHITKSIVGDYYNQLGDATSHGDQVFIRYNVKGIREICTRGLEDVLNHDIENPYNKLVRLMSTVEDTTIIHRFDLKMLKLVQKDMKDYLMMGGYDTYPNIYKSLSETYKKRGISPGGSADLWVLSTLFDKTRYLLKQKEVI